MTLTSIILAPKDGDPHGLLTSGLSTPPTVHRAWRMNVALESERPFWTSALATFHLSQKIHPKKDHFSGLALAWGGEAHHDGTGRAMRCLIKREGCPFEPEQVVLTNDLYRRSRAWRLVAFTTAHHVKAHKRWPNRVYAGRAHKQEGHHIIEELYDQPDWVPEDLTFAWALAVIAQNRGMGRALFLDGDGKELN